MKRAVLVLLVATSLSCGDDAETKPPDQTLTVPEGCNPIAADADCLLPFPSDVFRSSAGGVTEVVVPQAAQVRFKEAPVDLLAFRRPDGFSVGTPILALLPGPIDPAPLVFWTGDVAASTGPSSPTVLVDASTGALVAHFAELDPRTAGDPARQALILRPLERLAESTRYVVGIRGLSKTDGTAVEPPAGFKNLRDEAGAGHPALAALSPRYESEIFPLLEAAGAPRGELLLAWDFTTRSDESVTEDLLAIRDDVIAKAPSLPAPVIVAQDVDPGPHIARRIELTIEVPLYVDSPEPGAMLLSTGGRATSNGLVEVPVTVWIPPSVEDRAPGTPPARLLQFGHGFFGDRYECDDFPAELADAHGFVVVAADWWGMSADDRGIVLDKLLSDPANVLAFTERLHQGMANFLALGALAKTQIASLPELQIQGEPAYDASTLYFYGISMGHILGGTYLALSPEVERGVLGVGGADFSLMMFRARPFGPFLALIEIGMPDKLDQQKFAAMVQGAFDRVDPVTYAPFVLERPLPGAPAGRRVLMHTGIADAEVPNLASYYHARVLGLPVLKPASAITPLGLAEATAPHDGSALTIFDFGIAPTTEAMPASQGNDVHEAVRRTAAGQAQVDAFLRPGGLVESSCSGVCDPE
jgi:hypothetical protein